MEAFMDTFIDAFIATAINGLPPMKCPTASWCRNVTPARRRAAAGTADSVLNFIAAVRFQKAQLIVQGDAFGTYPHVHAVRYYKRGRHNRGGVAVMRNTAKERFIAPKPIDRQSLQVIEDE